MCLFKNQNSRARWILNIKLNNMNIFTDKLYHYVSLRNDTVVETYKM